VGRVSIDEVQQSIRCRSAIFWKVEDAEEGSLQEDSCLKRRRDARIGGGRGGTSGNGSKIKVLSRRKNGTKSEDSRTEYEEKCAKGEEFCLATISR
jgi:hypothetical protein